MVVQRLRRESWRATAPFFQSTDILHGRSREERELASESKSRAELQNARVRRAVDRPQCVRRRDARSRQAEIRVIQKVKEFAAQHEAHSFSNREALLHSRVDV